MIYTHSYMRVLKEGSLVDRCAPDCLACAYEAGRTKKWEQTMVVIEKEKEKPAGEVKK